MREVPPGSTIDPSWRIDPAAPATLGSTQALVLQAPITRSTFGRGPYSAFQLRGRWRVELVFKRLKSQIHLADLQAKDPQLARAALLATLILALLAEGLVAGLRRSFPAVATRVPAALLVAPDPHGTAQRSGRGAGASAAWWAGPPRVRLAGPA
jgi:hypothetical protein